MRCRSAFATASVVLLSVIPPAFAGRDTLDATAADVTTTRQAPPAALPTGTAATPSGVMWPTAADSGIVTMMPIPGGLVVLVDTTLSGRIDRVIAFHGKFALPASHFDSVGDVIDWNGGLCVLFHESREAIVFLTGRGGDAGRIRDLVPASYLIETVAGNLEIIRRTGNFGSISGPVVQDILYQDPGGDPPPPQPGCASSCTISCRDGSSCSCTAGASGCCSCSCGAVGGASCTHSS